MTGFVSAGARTELAIGLGLATATVATVRWSLWRLPIGKRARGDRKKNDRPIHYKPNRSQKRQWALSNLFEGRSRMERAFDHAQAIDEPRVLRLLGDAIQKCAEAEEIVKKAIAKE